jgi:hypothetical protein
MNLARIAQSDPDAPTQMHQQTPMGSRSSRLAAMAVTRGKRFRWMTATIKTSSLNCRVQTSQSFLKNFLTPRRCAF